MLRKPVCEVILLTVFCVKPIYFYGKIKGNLQFEPIPVPLFQQVVFDNREGVLLG